MGYGIGVFDGRGVLTLVGGHGLSNDGGQAWSAGWRFAGKGGLEWSLMGKRELPADGDPGYGIALEARKSW